MNIFNHIRNQIVQVCQEIASSENWPEIKLDAINAEQPKNQDHGDIATNAAMILASQIKQPPRKIAELIAEKLSTSELVTDVEVAGPGFINLRLEQKIWQQQIKYICEDAQQYSKTDVGKGHKANVEFVSANPTGPLHIGHARNAVVGDALARLMDFCGYDVTREYYINDAGAQIDVLAESTYLRYLELFGKFDGKFPEGTYPGEYLIAPAKKLKEKYADDLIIMEVEARNKIVRPFIIEQMMDLIRDDLAQLDISYDIFTSEKSLHDNKLVNQMVKFLEHKNLVYRGVLEPPKGQKPDDWEEREQLLFKTTSYGDDIDRPLQKSDGSWTYFASDIAYMKDKLDRKFDYLAILLGADHGGYVKRLKAAAKALSDNKADIDVKLCQLVNYMKHGKPFKMSKRKGNFATVRDIIEAVGKDIIRFIMLTRKNDVTLDFDVDQVVEMSKDNPVFYVQYAHARAKSVIRHAKEVCHEAYDIFAQNKSDVALLTKKPEISMIKTLAYWPKQIEQAAISHEPHRIAYALEAIASEFHAMWNKGKEENIKFIIAEEPELTAARLTLVEAVSKIISTGLNIIGVTAVDSM